MGRQIDFEPEGGGSMKATKIGPSLSSEGGEGIDARRRGRPRSTVLWPGLKRAPMR